MAHAVLLTTLVRTTLRAQPRYRAMLAQGGLSRRRTAHGLGLRFRLHRNDLPGTPDLVFGPRRIAVFVHGCFWHRHEGCKLCTTPKTRREFWAEKFAANQVRDVRIQKDLRDAGWRVMVIWECETRNATHVQRRLTNEVAGRSSS
ncbi:DNA mismatch endonuclease Vsr [Thiobacillus sp.]|uniref:very short patch repair endonuclease n=1 Tax=Thiobacillus sp. TaxID=924 RepID=UPI0034137C4E